MEDQRLENRKLKFQNPSFNLLESREEKRLSLRKEKIEELLFNKRQICRVSFELEIDPYKLDIPHELLEKSCENEEQLVKHIKFLVKSNDVNYIKLGILCCRKILSPKEKIKRTPAKLFVDNNFLEIFKNFLENTDDIQIIYEILWCLLNIISVLHGTETIFYTSDDMVKLYLKYLDHTNMEIVEETLKIIGNMVNDNKETKYVVFKSDIFAKIIDLTRKETIPNEIVKDIIWILYSLYKKQSGSLIDIPVEIGLCCLEVFLTFIFNDNREVKLECLTGLTLLAESAPLTVVRSLVEHQVIREMIASKSTLEDNSIKLAIIRVLGNLTGNNDNYIIKKLLSLELIDFLDFYLLDNNLTVRKEVAWVISNLVADTQDVLIEVLKHEAIINKIILLIKENEFTIGISVEAVNCLCNACLGCDVNLFETYLKQYNIFELLTFCLMNFSSNLNTLDLVLVTIHYLLIDLDEYNQYKNYALIFEQVGGITQLEILSNYKNSLIAEKVHMILEKIRIM